MGLVENAQHIYYLINDKWSDPRTTNYPLAQTPFHGLAIIAVYLLFTFSWGPRFMRNRPPFQIDRLVTVYNIIQILLSSYCFIAAIRACYWPPNYSLWCEPVETDESPEAIHVTDLVWLYYMIKIIDLMDTVFIVLRKKTSQLSVLHVYHHAGMVAIGWAGVKYVPGGQSILTGTVNSFVHTFMYSYYLLTAMDKRYASAWWKKHITQLQLVQFAIISTHQMIPLMSSDCGYPKAIGAIVVPSLFLLVLLFANFYWITYIRPEKEKRK